MIQTNSIKASVSQPLAPKTLTAAAVPVLLGIALAYKDAQQIQTLPALLCLLFAWVMQIDSNLVNDYFDFKHGNDDETRLGPKRACAEGWITLGSHEMGNHPHHPSGLRHRTSAGSLRWLGNGHRRHLLRSLLFSLYYLSRAIWAWAIFWYCSSSALYPYAAHTIS